MKTYYEVNGKYFEDKSNAIKYERKIEDERIEKEKFEKERQCKLEQINTREKELEELKGAFVKEYGEIHSISDLNYFPLDVFWNFGTD